MDRSLGTPAQPRIQDVTPQIQKTHLIYGSSDYTNPAYSSANKSLNYATGGSITSPERDQVKIIPYTINYQDTVGLFGKENHFIRIDVNIDKNYAFACFEEPGWECARITQDDYDVLNTYRTADIDPLQDLQTVNTYDPAAISQNKLGTKSDAYISVDLENLKTGNKYIDSWFDVRLYTKDRMEHPYNKMYVRIKDFFYIGFHARNTKRLPYNVKCVIGQEYLSGLEVGDRRYRNVRLS
jgi:hypothetical protein